MEIFCLLCNPTCLLHCFYQFGINVFIMSGSVKRTDDGRINIMLPQVLRKDFFGSKDPMAVLFIIQMNWPVFCF